MTFDLEIRGFLVKVRCFVTDPVFFGAIPNSVPSVPVPTSAMSTSWSSPGFGNRVGILEALPLFATTGLLNILPEIMFWFDCGDHIGSDDALGRTEERGDVTAPLRSTLRPFGLLVIGLSRDDFFLSPICALGFGAEVVAKGGGDATVSNFLVFANELAVGANNLEVTELVLKWPGLTPILPAPTFEVAESPVVPSEEVSPEPETVAIKCDACDPTSESVCTDDI